MGQEKKVLFVISPIGDEGSSTHKNAADVYEKIITPAAKRCGYVTVRIDRISHHGDIRFKIANHLIQDHMAVADLTGHNPNVFFELGLRHALQKPVIHIALKDTLLPFDISGVNTIFYDLTGPGIERCRNALIKTIRDAEESPDNLDTFLRSAVESHALQNILLDIKDIKSSISTRYIGKMAAYYEQVIKLLRDAKESIDILCDYPAYGCFTDPRHWNVYTRVLQDIRRDNKVNISLTCPDQRRRDENDKKNYFPMAWDRNTWESWKQEHLDEIGLFLKYIDSDNQNVATLTRETFFKIFRDLDKIALKDCFGKDSHNRAEANRKVEIYEVNGIPPLDFWIIDKDKAVFAFSNYAHGSSRYGFSTEHEKLISAFGEIKDSYHHKRA